MKFPRGKHPNSHNAQAVKKQVEAQKKKGHPWRVFSPHHFTTYKKGRFEI